MFTPEGRAWLHAWWLATVAIVTTMTAGCGSRLPEGRVVYATPAAPSEQSLTVARSELANAPGVAGGLVMPSRLRVTSASAAVMDVLVVLPNRTAPYHLTPDQQLTAIQSALAWRYGGMGRDVDISVNGRPVQLARAFYDDFTTDELNAVPREEVLQSAIAVRELPPNTAYCIAVVLRLHDPITLGHAAMIRIRDTSLGLAGASTRDLWTQVPIVDESLE